MNELLTVGGRQFKPGTKEVIALPVTTDLDGTVKKLYVHVITGVEPGPTLALLSTLHGGEFLSIEVIRRLVEAVDPTVMKGTILAVPVGNPVALQALTRNTPDESDSPDLNRVFPGQFTWIAEQLATTITEEVIKKADFLIDFHMGLWGCSMGVVSYGIDYDPETVARSRELAHAFGYPCVKQGHVATHFPGPRSAQGYAASVLKIPSIGADIGGAGFDKEHEEGWLKINRDGIRNVMIYTGMLDGEMTLPERYLVWQKRWRVNPSVGGLLMPQVPGHDLMRRVQKGELLANVVSPYSFEILETLESPGDGLLMYTARDYPVRPGDWAFGVVDLADENSRWIDSPLSANGRFNDGNSFPGG